MGKSQSHIDIDSINFEQQRERVNNLLEQRSKRFGEFDHSLRQKTGVFGIFKRKKDMQKSIDILREIVLTDNDIFLETKKLLYIKENESDRKENLASAYDKQISGYMHTITKLQTENEKLRNQINDLESKQRNRHRTILLLVIIILALSFTLYLRMKPHKPKNLTQE
ncbi:hypothetical protein H8B06_20115 [Sphingobacterium sp. DN00404]|uniref:Uncharacterized protein n=1 Tax=Sphingobacterium micropteri TaxID=2763501 RepID=A0ABR7YV25_9SPHI|nr:hypothetical protein [Sphingobacterium micropteri]MBD1435135.1 hypothetical protein [Sphingobacterium micropteri]